MTQSDVENKLNVLIQVSALKKITSKVKKVNTIKLTPLNNAPSLTLSSCTLSSFSETARKRKIKKKRKEERKKQKKKNTDKQRK